MKKSAPRGDTSGKDAENTIAETWPLEVQAKLDRFRSAALDHGIPAADVDRWLGLARRCLLLAPDVEGPVAGRFGGPLMLPSDAAVPLHYDESPDEPEHLIATLDLAALPEGASGLPLPPEGHLLLFAWPELEASEDATCRSGHAVYIPAGVAVGHREVEYDYDAHCLVDAGFASRLRRELRVGFDVSLPDHELFDSDPLLAEHPHARELRRVWSDAITLDASLNSQPRLQIGGYAVDREGWGDPVTRCARGAEAEISSAQPPSDGQQLGDWLLLAQWHPQIDNLEFVTMYWAISEKNLVARRFAPTRTTMYANP